MCDCVHTGGCQRTCHLCIQSLLSIFFEVGSLTLHCISQPGWHTSFLGFSWLHHSSCIGELALQRLSILHHFTWVLWIQLGSSWLSASLLLTKIVFQTWILGGNGRFFSQRLLHFTSLLVNVVRLLISPPHCQTYYVTLITSYLCGRGLVSLCGFDFHFPND